MLHARLAARTFDMADQTRFAAVSGDCNPMHLDAVVARRTPAGAPAVHGVHMLLWALDAFARGGGGGSPVRRLTARFKRFVAINEAVAINVTKRTESRRMAGSRGFRPVRGADRRRFRRARDARGDAVRRGPIRPGDAA